MKITIINGAPGTDYQAFTDALHALDKQLGDGYDITVFDVDQMDIHYCIGCFKCWVKTPGKCLFRDDMDKILSSDMQSDVILYATPLLAGALSSQTKKVLDRSIPIVLPYIREYHGECHHPQRYENRPNIGFLLLDDGKINDVSKDILFSLPERLSKNFRTEIFYQLTAKADQIAEVIQDEISIS